MLMFTYYTQVISLLVALILTCEFTATKKSSLVAPKTKSHHLQKRFRRFFPSKILRITERFRLWPKIIVRVTAYVVNTKAHGCDVNAGRTATGTIAKTGTIAVDTRIFPFGTHFYVPGYGYGIGSDTGSYIQGRHIDIAMNSCHDALTWGRPLLAVWFSQ